MAVVAIIPLPEPGHINPTIRLARELRERGHDVKFVSAPAAATLFRQRGLPTVIASERPWVEPWEIDFSVDLTPDVALVESTFPYLGMWAWRLGWNIINLSVLFPRGYEASVPPLGTRLLPSATAEGKRLLREAWAAERRANTERRMLGVRRLADRIGFPAHLLDERSALGVTLRFPELALVPEVLDFPRAANPMTAYAGPCVELMRTEPEFDFTQLTNGKKLVYCSVGTQVKRYPSLPGRLSTLVEAARRLPDLQVVIATGIELLEAHLSAPLPSNVVLLRNAPQLAMLQRAAVMLTHGGINAINEALCCGVPLIVLPFDIDQPGNAARIEYHGLGKCLPWEEATPDVMANAIRCMIENGAINDRVRAMSGRLRSMLEEPGPALAFEQCWARCR